MIFIYIFRFSIDITSLVISITSIIKVVRIINSIISLTILFG